MDRAVFDRMDEWEATHWWFAGRRILLRTVLQRLVKPGEQARLLEAGCGSGGNLGILSGFGAVDAFEPDEQARLRACQKTGLSVHAGALPDSVPFTGPYDVIALFDVLEHIEADRDSLSTLGHLLRPGGAIVLTVPAFPALWSAHDDAHHHFRRYTRTSLSALSEQAGLGVDHIFYCNSFLFGPAVAIRTVKKALRNTSPDDTLPAPTMNAVLRGILASERHLIGRLRLPFGLSLCAVLRRP